MDRESKGTGQDRTDRGSQDKGTNPPKTTGTTGETNKGGQPVPGGGR
jgi:hypothetical protein